jgi:hypothetical protein
MLLAELSLAQPAQRHRYRDASRRRNPILAHAKRRKIARHKRRALNLNNLASARQLFDRTP